MKVDLRPSIAATVMSVWRATGKFSELKEKGLLKDPERYERYITMMKKALSEEIKDSKEFKDRFLSELDPSWEEKLKTYAELGEKEELNEDQRKLAAKLTETYFDLVNATGFAAMILRLNDSTLEEKKTRKRSLIYSTIH